MDSLKLTVSLKSCVKLDYRIFIWHRVPIVTSIERELFSKEPDRSMAHTDVDARLSNYAFNREIPLGSQIGCAEVTSPPTSPHYLHRTCERRTGYLGDVVDAPNIVREYPYVLRCITTLNFFKYLWSSRISLTLHNMIHSQLLLHPLIDNGFAIGGGSHSSSKRRSHVAYWGALIAKVVCERME